MVPHLVIGSTICVGDVVNCDDNRLGHVTKLSYHMDEGYMVTVQPDGGVAFHVPPIWVLEHLTKRRPVVVEIVAGHVTA